MYKAVIFDMDWVLTDSEHSTFLSDQFTLSTYGIKEFSINDFKPNTWKSLKLRIPLYEHKYWIKIDFESYSEIFIKKQLELILDDLSKERENMIIFFKQLREKWLKIAVATSARKNKAQPILETLGILQFLNSFIHLDSVNHGKPDPEPYLLSAKNLSLTSKDCLVIEDSVSWIKSWKSAWMNVLAMKSDAFTREEQHMADGYIDKLSDIFNFLEC